MSQEQTPLSILCSQGWIDPRLVLNLLLSAEATLTVTTVGAAPVYSAVGIAALSADPGSGPAPLGVSFGVTPVGGSGAYTYSWDFESNGSVDSTASNPSFIYENDGTFTVKVIVTDVNNSANRTTGTLSVISVSYPVAYSPIGISGLSVSPGSGIAPMQAGFNITVSGGSGNYLYSWDLDNNGTVDSTGQNPKFTYNSAGTFTAVVTVTDNADPSNTTTGSLIINVSNPPAAYSSVGIESFIVNSGSGVAPLDVGFGVTAVGGSGSYTYSWDFNDDGSIDSSVQNPGFTYHNAGTYTARVTVTDANNTGNTVSGSVVISALDSPVSLNVGIAASKITGEAPHEVTFTATISGDSPPYTVSWYLGDTDEDDSGNPTEVQVTEDNSVQISHVYEKAGVYQVWVEVVSGNGAGVEVETLKTSISISVGESVAAPPVNETPADEGDSSAGMCFISSADKGSHTINNTTFSEWPGIAVSVLSLLSLFILEKSRGKE